MRVAGFGFRGAATEDSLRSALNLAGGRADALAAPEDKCVASALTDLAASMKLPVCPVQPGALRTSETQTQSSISQAARGTGSVAEGCALAAAGPGAVLVSPRRISQDRLATCAIAERREP